MDIVLFLLHISGLKPLLVIYFRLEGNSREENFAGGKFREILFGVDIIFAGGKFGAKSKFANIAKISSTRKIGVIQLRWVYTSDAVKRFVALCRALSRFVALSRASQMRVKALAAYLFILPTPASARVNARQKAWRRKMLQSSTVLNFRASRHQFSHSCTGVTV